jgi:flavin reductase (DIM6/NTAB) family NADH-FMN oxidoreductase RutF
MSIKTIEPFSISQTDLQNYLVAAVAPRPIAFASTVDKDGNVNLSPFSFFNVFSSNPPVLIFSPARSGRDNTTKHSYQNVKEIPEVSINIVNFPMVEQMSLSSTAYAKGVNEFVKAGFTEVPSQKIRPPRVKEAPVSFECVVDNVIELGDSNGAGNLVIARIVLIHIQEAYLGANGALDTQKLDLVARMGENWYCRASGDALFEIPKPISRQGIGVDALSLAIRNSSILTGNNLGRLGNVEQLPSATEIAAVRSEAAVQEILNRSNINQLEALHRLAQRLLDGGQTEKALAVLYVIE